MSLFCHTSSTKALRSCVLLTYCPNRSWQPLLPPQHISQICCTRRRRKEILNELTVLVPCVPLQKENHTMIPNMPAPSLLTLFFCASVILTAIPGAKNSQEGRKRYHTSTDLKSQFLSLGNDRSSISWDYYQIGNQRLAYAAQLSPLSPEACLGRQYSKRWLYSGANS